MVILAPAREPLTAGDPYTPPGQSVVTVYWKCLNLKIGMLENEKFVCFIDVIRFFSSFS